MASLESLRHLRIARRGIRPSLLDEAGRRMGRIQGLTFPTL
jgi:hypothetical protein